MNINIFLSTIGINTYKSNFKFVIYFIFLLFLISYIPLYYGVYNIFILKTTDQIIKCLIMFNDIYLYCIMFNSSLIKFTEKFLNEDINPNIKNKYVNPVLKFIIFISIISSIIFSILSFNNININLIDDISNDKYIRSIITFFYIYFSFQIKIYSTLLFFSIFYTISNYLTNYSNLFENNNYSIPDITQQFIEIRHKYGNAVTNLNSILSGSIIFNFIPVSLLFIKIFSNEQYNILNFISAIYFILSIGVIHFTLKKINDSVDKIKNILDNNRYLRLFLERKKDTYSINIELDELDEVSSNQINLKNYLIEIENGDSIDWIIINNVIFQSWKSFEIFGFEFKNNNIISKLLSLIILLWIGKSVI